MGRKRKHPKHKQTKPKWYQKENDWGDFVFDIGLGMSGEVWRAIFGLISIITATVIVLGFFGSAGQIGSSISEAAAKIFGPLGVYFFVIAFFYFGYILLVTQKGEKAYAPSRFIGIFLFMASFPAFFHLFIPIEDAKDAVSLVRGGGTVGYMITTPLRDSIGLFPSFLAVVAAIFVSILMIFNVSMAKYFRGGDEEEELRSKVNINNSNSDPVPQRVSVFELMKRKFLRRNPNRGRAPVIEVAPPERMERPTRGMAWEYPPLDILKESDDIASSGNIEKNADIIRKTLENFGIKVATKDVNVGPTVTQYTLKPDTGVKLNQIVARQNDLALALSAKSLRVEAPIPGKDLVGLEIPNKIGAKVTLKEVLDSNNFKSVKSKLAIALGRDVAGDPISVDLEKMPHALVAGATGSGKSVCINSIIIALLFNNSPEDLKLLLVDPKRVELTGYNGIPHLLTPVVTEVDKIVSALKWAVSEMERRYEIFSKSGKRNILAYNAEPTEEGSLPYIVIIIDELADLMATSSKDVESSIVRIAQMARATGIHLIVATQRPSVDVLTGLIKANISTRIAFATASQVDSRTILDMSGAEKLLGNGDMLYISNGIDKPRRIQGCFVSDGEIEELNNFLRSKSLAQYDESILTFRSAKSGGGFSSGEGSGDDDLYDDAVETVMQAGKASASLLQRRLRVGYARAARLLDILEENGVIGPSDGAKPRDVLISNISADGYQPRNNRREDDFNEDQYNKGGF